MAQTFGTEGFGTAQEFVDSRELLQWDVVYGCFNKRESRLVDDGTGNMVWMRRYWHIFPLDFDTQSKTYTNGPLTALQIMDALFAAPTVKTGWSGRTIPRWRNRSMTLTFRAGRSWGLAWWS